MGCDSQSPSRAGGRKLRHSLRCSEGKSVSVGRCVWKMQGAGGIQMRCEWASGGSLGLLLCLAPLWAPGGRHGIGHSSIHRREGPEPISQDPPCLGQLRSQAGSPEGSVCLERGDCPGFVSGRAPLALVPRSCAPALHPLCPHVT